MVVREYIGKYRLDEILEQKEEISGFICARLKEVQDEYCIELLTVLMDENKTLYKLNIERIPEQGNLPIIKGRYYKIAFILLKTAA